MDEKLAKKGIEMRKAVLGAEYVDNAIANMVQQIRDGKTFHLPNVLESPTDE